MDNNELYEYVKDLKDDIRDVKADVKDVKNDVKDVKAQVDEVYDEVIKINYRLKETEGRVHLMKEETILRKTECGRRMDSLTPNAPLLRYLNSFAKNPKFTLLAIIAFIVVVQTIILHAIDNNWFMKIIDAIIKY